MSQPSAVHTPQLQAGVSPDFTWKLNQRSMRGCYSASSSMCLRPWFAFESSAFLIAGPALVDLGAVGAFVVPRGVSSLKLAFTALISMLELFSTLIGCLVRILCPAGWCHGMWIGSDQRSLPGIVRLQDRATYVQMMLTADLKLCVHCCHPSHPCCWGPSARKAAAIAKAVHF
jgi:hypothetical protein